MQDYAMLSRNFAKVEWDLLLANDGWRSENECLVLRSPLDGHHHQVSGGVGGACLRVPEGIHLGLYN